MSEYFLSTDHEAAARNRQGQLTKPPGSLGRLEELAVQLAAFQHTKEPAARPCSAVIFASDHPVTKHGISPYPSAVTQAMVANFQTGGAAASVLARRGELPLHVVDMGVEGGPVEQELPAGDVRVEDGMSEEVFAACVEKGERYYAKECRGDRVLILGEMGIGNTTPSAALCAWLVDAEDPAELVGAGTGADGELLEKKKQVVRDVVRRLGEESSPEEALRRAGGREMAAMYGCMRAALSKRCAVLVDGFIVSTVAALLVAENPAARNGMIFAHRSDEQAHGRVLAHLEVKALLDLGMRLGEASGALTAFPLLESACSLHNQMATFSSAGVPDRDEQA